MTRKRSTYRPKRIVRNPLVFLCKTPAAQRQKTMARFQSALVDITQGRHPGPMEWRDLCDVVNVLETLVVHTKQLVPEEVQPTIDQASLSMKAAARRFQAGQGMRLDAPGIQAMRDALNVYEQCLELLTEREMEVAIAETARAIDEVRKHADCEVVSL
jgi:hypothetical protein